VPRPRKLRDGKIAHVYLERETYGLLQAIARREGKSVSELIRSVLESWLEGEAKTKYGVELVLQEAAVARLDGSRAMPLTSVMLADAQRAVAGMKEAMRRMKERLPQIEEEARGLAQEVERLGRIAAEDRPMLVGGEAVSGSEYARRRMPELRRRAGELLKEVEEYERARRKFFKVAYYPWFKLRKEVDLDTALTVESDIAVLVEQIGKIRDRVWRLKARLQRLAGDSEARVGVRW